MRQSARDGLRKVFARLFRRSRTAVSGRPGDGPQGRAAAHARATGAPSLRGTLGSAPRRGTRLGTADPGWRGTSRGLFGDGGGPRLPDRGRAPEFGHLAPPDLRPTADPAPLRLRPEPHRSTIFLHDIDD
ncbi:hypothetical protein ACIBCR_11450 [Micromonospora echinospora]|uniref:hypothetical protein n=1 Tax=Micromonospora echinospora TaxID=1877 RepID=UPI0037AD318D